MVTSLVEEVQAPLEIVHRKTYAVADVRELLLNDDVGLLTLPNVYPAGPLTTLQLPVPEAGVLAASVVDVPQIVWLGPALEVVGTAATVIVTVVADAVQGAFDIVQRKT